MTDDNNQQPAAANTPPAAIPWYRSTVLVGILTAVCTQVIARVQAKYHVDLAVFGINANDLAGWVLDGISAAAVAWAAHGRVTQKASPQVTLKPSTAKAINAQSPSTQQPDKPAGA